jgi:very-short-patch-repair endonuclease
MGIFICKICEKECEGINSLRSHSIQKHNISAEEIYLNYILNGVKPKCECGCDEITNFISVGKGYSKFIQSHHNRVPGKNNYHKNPETHQKAIDTQKKNWKEGKYKGWWEDKTPETIKKIEGIKEKLRNNKERGKRISEKLKGIPKSEESKIKLSITQKIRYKNNPKLREELSKIRLKWMRDNSKVKTSKLEIKFMNILNSIGLIKDIDFTHNYLVSNIKTFFDFYLPLKKIIIEVDGDFYHCNPNTKYSTPKYEIQVKNKSNDKRKNTWCQNHGIKLLRYWEKDINERPEWIISELKKELCLQKP